MSIGRVRAWNQCRPLFPRRQVNPPIGVDFDSDHRSWLTAIHRFFKPPATSGSQAVHRAAGWRCAQALQWATSSPSAGLGYLVRQSLRAGWTLEQPPLPEAVAALRPYRSGSPDEPVEKILRRTSTRSATISTMPHWPGLSAKESNLFARRAK